MQRRLISVFRRSAALTALLVSGTAATAQDSTATDTPGRTILLGGVIDFRPDYPGASERSTGFFPLIAVWNDGEPMPVETPDESFGINFIGDDETVSAGLALSGSPRRRRDATPFALNPVGFGMEVGGFAQSWVGEHLRLRTELRQAIGGHEALTGDVAADVVYRGGNDRLLLTAGPRVRWGSAGFNRRYFGVSSAEALASGLAAYQPGSGVYAYGTVASAHWHFTEQWAVYAYGGYERLTGAGARSPIVRALDSRDQTSFGLGLSYRFGVGR